MGDATTLRWICAECGDVQGKNASKPSKEPSESAVEEGKCSCGRDLKVPTIYEAAKFGLRAEFEQLLHEQQQTGEFDINAREPISDATILHHAALNSRMGILEFIFRNAQLREAIEIDPLGGELKTTPLFWACFHNHIYAVELLLRHGADINFTDEAGFNPFLLAVQRGFPILAAYLVAKGADVATCVRDGSEKTALMLCCARDRFHLDTFRMLLSLHTPINAQDRDGNTALHYAARNDVSMAIRMLLDMGADATIQNREGQTPRDLGLLYGHRQTRRCLNEEHRLLQLSRWTHVPRFQLERLLQKCAFFVPWIFLPVSCWIVTSTHGVWWILLKQLLLIAATFGSLHVFQLGAYGSKYKATPLLFGINVASVTWLVLPFAHYAWGIMSFWYILLVYLSVLGIAMCLYLTVTRDAGVISTNYHEKLESIKSLVEMKSRTPSKLCLTCLHKRPIRSKHCAELNVCIARFDHYCPYTANGIGLHNHNTFMGFLVFAVFAIGLELFAFYQFGKTRPELAIAIKPSTNPLIPSWLSWFLRAVNATFVHFPVLGCAGLLATIHILWIGYLMLFQLYLVGNAVTTNEFVKNEYPFGVFSKGIVANLLDFFHLKASSDVNWFRVYSVDDALKALVTAKDVDNSKKQS